jgi:plastocyanin
MSNDHKVNIDDMAFVPDTININAGDTVTWSNLDAVGHSACRDMPPPFDTGVIARGDTSDPIAFSTAGSYDYFCRQHRRMTGKVVVS